MMSEMTRILCTLWLAMSLSPHSTSSGPLPIATFRCIRTMLSQLTAWLPVAHTPLVCLVAGQLPCPMICLSLSVAKTE